MNPESILIERIRKQWGARLLILGHHYQRDGVLAHADAIGDSLELARRAAAESRAERIAFCGVHFMAESADILSGGGRSVYMPVPDAGCPMANMADLGRVQTAWEEIGAAGGQPWLPVVYVNSSAAIKAFCGENGGSACTSGNAAKVMKWVLDQGHRVFFLPDQHLGENTAIDLGVARDEVAVFDHRQARGGLTEETLRSARVLVWKGFCLVHTRFTVEQIRQARAQWPGARVIVHPETPREVVAAADAHGSTARIIEYVNKAPDASVIVIGTELNLVDRLARQTAGRVTVKALAPSVCRNMNMTDEASLMALLERWPAERRISVPPEVADRARLALDRMLAV